MPEKSLDNPILRLKTNHTEQILYFFGARHTNDPADTQFSQLKKFFDEFLNIAKSERVVFIEGATREIPQNYEEAILEYGEAGAIHWLAKKENIDVIRPEPKEEEQRKLLCALFKPQTVAYTVIVQNLAGWFRHRIKTNFEEAIARVLNREAKFSSTYGFVPDKVWFESEHRRLFGEQRLEDKNFLDSISDPRKSDTIVNNIIASRSKIRDESILSAVREAWKSGKSIFIVYGKGHLVALEQELKKLI